MALNDDKDIIKLIIDAENLATDELLEITQDIKVMGDEANAASKDLDKLKIEKQVIDSYSVAKTEVEALRVENAKSKVEFENLTKAVKNNKAATNDQREALVLAGNELKAQNNQLRSLESVYTKASNQARKLGIDTTSLAKTQELVNKDIITTQNSLTKLNLAYDKNVKVLSEKTVAEQKARVATLQKIKDLEKANALVEKYAAEVKAEIALEQKLALEKERVAKELKQYEIALAKLNAERDKGKISAGEAIKREQELRAQYNLTEKQVKSTQAAMKADNLAKTSAVKNTDLVTSATRRLAQAYTVLIAAQTATRAISTSVQNYGDLEAAIIKVEKTTDLAKDKLVQLTEEIITLSTDVTPTATNELLKMAEVAGQLGVTGTDNLLKMVAAADALEVSTNLAGEEAALLLTRILTMTGEGIPKIDALSSSVVALGNNFAVSESEIVQMTKEIITGTQSINLGSEAAAAYGTVLKEMGQSGERSRTSMFKLSQAIKTASADGGDDLERLIKYTKLTGDEIEKSLGERPETVITALINGFAEATESGANLTDILGSMGIDGSIAVTTIEALVNGSDRMNLALETSNKAFEAQNAHFVEASKAYGSQNAALGRLVNKFTELTASIGEAYSDETDSAIRLATGLIDDNGQSVIELTNLMGGLGEALSETFGIVDNLAAAFVGAETNGDALGIMILGLRVSFNAISVAANNLIYTFQTVVVGWMELANALSEDLVSDEALVNFRKGMAETREDVNRDLQDMLDASDDYHKKSSSGYRDLMNTVDKYAYVIDDLSESEKTQLDAIVTRGTYLESEEKLYNKLNAALVAKNRQIEVLNKSEEIRLAQAEKQRIVDEAATKAAEEYGAAKLKATVLNGDFSNSLEDINKLVAEEEELVKKGLITKEEMLNFINRLVVAKDQENSSFNKSTKSLLDNKNATSAFTNEASKLYALYDDGKLTIEELQLTYDNLGNSYSSVDSASKNLTTSTATMTVEMAELHKEVDKASSEVEKYQTALNKDGITTSEVTTLTIKLTAAKAKLKDLQQEQLTLSEQENLTYPQLIALQRTYTTDLETLNRAWESGVITKGVYLAQSTDLKNKLSELGAVLPVITSGTDKQTKSIDTQTKSIKANTTALVDNIEKMSTAAKVQANLNTLVRESGELIEQTSGGSTGASDKGAALYAELGERGYLLALQKYKGDLDAAFRYEIGYDDDKYNRDGTKKTAEEIEEYNNNRAKFFQSDNSNNTTTKHEVTITLPTGNTSTISTTSSEDADSLISALMSLGEVNLSGIT